MIDLNKHIVPDDKSLFHSHGFAKLANGEQIGSSANISFNERLTIENNRQLIGGYNKSAIGNTYSAVRPKTVDGPNGVAKRGQLILPQNRVNRLNIAPRKFTEPSARTYNPFS